MDCNTRALRILQLIAYGKDPSLELHFSGSTIRRELYSLYNFLGVNNRAHAVAEAFRRKLIK